jgi:hypothetical protein
VGLLSIVAFRGNFGKSAEAVGSPGLVPVVEDEGEKLFDRRFTAKDFHVIEVTE